MEWLEASTENCPVQRALNVIGEKWTLLILRDAVNGVRRFDDFHRHIG
ncbi:winged helix-turn-helix transcriptional regulator, partial [Streptomyces sp. NPDC007983]